ncbi:MAG: serine hydrolase [Kofleriaceae bacterium]
MKTAFVFGLALLVACVSANPPVVAPAATTDPLAAEIDRRAAETLASGKTAGVSVAILRDDKLAFAKGYGYANLAGKRAADADTVYRIGSVTKQFTAAAIVQLVEAGKLTFATDVRTLVDIPTGGRTVTILQLLQHSSGMPSYTEIPSFKAILNKSHTPAQIVALVKDTPWDFEPGTRFHYSNTGYVVLGMVIEKVSGESYAGYLAKHVFPKAGLTRTTYCDETKPDPHRATGYELDDRKALVPARPIDMSFPFSAGALCSTVIDLLRWDVALRTGNIVSPAGYQQMIAPGHGNYGFGLFVAPVHGHLSVRHGGGINGFVSELAGYPDDRITIAVLTNAETSAAPALEKQVALRALNIPSRAVPITAAALAPYAGIYVLPGLGDASLVIHDTHLEISVVGQPTFELEHRGHHTFANDQLDATFTFTFAGGVATKLLIVQHGKALEGLRKVD